MKLFNPSIKVALLILAVISTKSLFAESHTINAGIFYYSPSELTISVGDTVYWYNDGGFHNVNADINSITNVTFNNPESFVSSATSTVGALIYSHVFSIAGEYSYDCSIGSHAAYGMVGTINVVLAGCTDALASNYNPDATLDDETCVYSSYTPTSHAVNAGGYYYYPTNLTVNVGDTVNWYNDGGFHNVNADINSITNESYNNPESFISSATFTVGALIYSHVFTVPGNYTYDCSIGNHAVSGMVGTVNVLLLGCTDPTASNYNPQATTDDGTCEIETTEGPCDITPSGLFVDNIIHNRVVFNWSAPAEAPSYYMIRYRPVGTTQWTV
ncbi:MAG: plastocyanin/azurin family copper-binding protein, partial [Bacteroidota bacterium]|nr:plastocyanin/azurin family copper-binding protein [Bacteroidota bacterium]